MQRSAKPNQINLLKEGEFITSIEFEDLTNFKYHMYSINNYDTETYYNAKHTRFN